MNGPHDVVCPGRGRHRPARRPRGASYLLLALVSAVGATAVFGVLSLATAQTYTETVARSVAAARTQSSAALAAAHRSLLDDPYVLLHTVLDVEPPRICNPDPDIAGVGGGQVNAGQPWDLARCGATWSYVDGGDVDQATVQLTYQPDDGAIIARATTTVDGTTAGWETEWAMSTVADYLLASGTDLELGAVLTEPVEMPRSIIYARGAISGDRGLLEGDDILLVEDPPAGEGGDGGVTALPDGDTLELDEFSTTARSFATLTAHVADLAHLACPDDHTDPNDQQLLHDGTAPYLCLAPGRTYFHPDTGAPEPFPDNIAAFAITTTSDNLEIRWTDTQPDELTCPAGCDLKATEQRAIGSDTHPGHPTMWSAPVRVAPPSSGLIGTTRPIHLGMAYTEDDDRPSRPGDTIAPVTFARPHTLIAGDPTRPVDITVGAPITGTPPGLVATGNIRLAHWARPPGPGGHLAIDAHLVALALQRPGGNGITPWPAEVCTADSGDAARCATNTAGRLTVTGTLTDPDLDLQGSTDHSQYEHLTVAPARAGTVPPLLPSFHPTWTERSIRPVGNTEPDPDLNADQEGGQ